jgi:SAM-dependent MidA family methyltransferase
VTTQGQHLTPLGEILRDAIRRGGPIPFRDFMAAALYHPEHGYYRRRRDPFGRQGDFFTASQLQPVYGNLVGALLRRLGVEGTVIELGAGRSEMAAGLKDFDYRAVEIGGEEMPRRFRGAVFSNEFFDALPVHRVVFVEGAARESLVGWSGSAFGWVTGDPVTSEVEAYLDRYLENEDRVSGEAGLEALRWVERIAASLERGVVVTVDYGYTRAESKRFPDGTLMSYRRHMADEDVLACPGERDITAHACFTAIQEHGAARGLAVERFTTLRGALLEVAQVEAMDARERLQLKTLLFGMGETFRVLVQRKE